MKIAYITAGAAGMYCGSCMHDNTLVRALRTCGEDAVLLPTYTPIRTDVEDVSERRIFYGGIGVYLEQVAPLWRRLPRWASGIFDRPALLRLAGRIAIGNRAADLGALTISVLRGEAGNQRGDLEELVHWLQRHVRPDVIHLTNSLLSGLAPTLARRLGAPVLCTLQGEDLFLEGLTDHYREEAIALIRENAAMIAGFIAVSEYYREFMAGFIGLPVEKIRVVRPGVPGELVSALSGTAAAASTAAGATTTIGYLARICQEKGVGLLARAFTRLKTMSGMDDVRLRIAGYLGPADRSAMKRVMADLRGAGLGGDVQLVGTLDYRGKLEFLSSIDIFSVPAVYREPKGLYVLEALAAAVPVVLPRHGAFPELVEATGGGLLVDARSEESLAEGLARLVRDRRLRRELGERGRAGLLAGHTDKTMAEAVLAVYREVLDART